MDKKIYIFISPKRVRLIPKVPRNLKKDKYVKEDIVKMFGISISEYYKWKRYHILPMKRETLEKGGIIYTITKEDLSEFIKNHIFKAQLKVIIK